MSIGALTEDEGRQLDAMPAALFDLVRESSNKGYGTYEPPCNRYGNGQANAVAALLAVARLLDDRARFDAALLVGNAAIPVVTPWVRLFDHAIYGRDDVPSRCFPNSGPGAATSHPS